MRSRFPGFPPEALQFFRDLARHNRREWFQPRKAVYEDQVKRPMLALVEALNGELRRFSAEYATDPNKAIYRIYRDTRFSQDKTPYKLHIAASFHRRGTVAHGQGGFYCEVSHQGVGIGGGVYMPDPPQLLLIRRHIEEHHREFRRVLAARALRRLFGGLFGDQLTRIPKGFSATHPAADLLRYKRFILYAELPAGLATTPALFTEIAQRFRAMKPFMDFLAAPVTRETAPARFHDAW